jgi:hypothetical protein
MKAGVAPVTVVHENQMTGSGVTSESGSGAQELQVEENPDCESALKVTEPMTAGSS